ncbi:MAG: TatD family hydrolase [Candidatus Nomurabacteria bacterium]|nr:MAG: TatD family hydrolase [Candidatus Nomurabacteria bacterium]
MLIDTHCHIHEADYPLSVDDVLKRAAAQGVEKMICVGTSEQSSEDAIKFAAEHDSVYAAVGVHPHDSKDGCTKISEFAKQGVVAVGEIGLDYFYNHSSRDVQIAALESQIQTALDNNLPIIFHVREAFDDFWPVFDNFHGIRGELHSFTDIQTNLDKAFERGLFVGVNGISTFTKDPAQQKLYATVPLDKMLLETDAPFLTPTPYRGTINEPAYVSEVAKHHSAIRGISVEDVAAATTANATALFKL